MAMANKRRGSLALAVGVAALMALLGAAELRAVASAAPRVLLVVAHPRECNTKLRGLSPFAGKSLHGEVAFKNFMHPSTGSMNMPM
jgi:hypothetical protein